MISIKASRLVSRYSRLGLHTQVQRAETMPYPSNEALPAAVREHLPDHAQDIYRETFNHAFAAHVGDPRQEEAAHRIAWAAVKRTYRKVGERWQLRD